MYLINQENQLIQSTNLNQLSDLNLFATPNLIGKKIIKISNGLHSNFAVEKEEIPPISQWKNEYILDWAQRIGFDDYVNILKYQNINGEQLAKADKNFLIDKIGITKYLKKN
jgi:hypothetical protein